VSPILVRPVREQLEHDRIIRLLQTKWRRKYDAGINPGSEQAVPVGVGPSALYPDLVLSSLERGKRLQIVVEVETGESVNHLEALAEWAHLARVRAAFHLYVPSGMVDVARRLCENSQIHVNEIWSYNTIGDEVRFALVHRSRTEAPSSPRVKAAPSAAKPGATAVKAVTTAAKTGATAAKKGAAPAKNSSKAATKPAKAPAKSVRAKPARSVKPAAAVRKPARAQKRK
jgi:hypothetical protein